MNVFLSKKQTRAFTLIELLIVVAIIAILAAIAVPNFLEAQTRAAVSRVKADCKALGTAMELYYVDEVTYPGHWEREGFRHATHSAGFRLSTPIAYIANAQIRDPFKKTDSNDPTRADQVWLNIYSGNRGQSGANVWPKNCYAITSFGPDRTDDTNMGNFPFGGGCSTGEYDPTNGTKSRGEIWRCSPKPPKHWITPGANIGNDPFSY